MTAIQTSIISIIVAVAGIAAALGFCDTATEKLIVSSAAVIVPAVISIVAQLEGKTVAAVKLAEKQAPAKARSRA